MRPSDFKSPKVALIGNCQVRPLANILELFFGFKILNCRLVHRPMESSEEELFSVCQQADFILTQPIRSNYHIESYRTDRLIERFGEKVVLWPNLYFTGYNPELTYIRQTKTTHLPGPLGDYHIREIIGGYVNGESVQDVSKRLLDLDYNHETYGASWSQSLAELKRRESAFDTAAPVANFLEDRGRFRKLLYTFNHPCNLLFGRVAQRICQRLGIRTTIGYLDRVLNEPLNEIQMPINPYIAHSIPSLPASIGFYIGKSNTRRYGHSGSARERKIFSRPEIVEEFYKLYGTYDVSSLRIST